MTYEYFNAKPSEIDDIFFLHATNDTMNYPPPVKGKSGKWIIFLKQGEELDSMWRTIQQALLAGKLGRRAKVSTMKSHFCQISKGKGFICVYTYNIDDTEDIRQIRDELRTLGVTWKIPYLLDIHGEGYLNQGKTGLGQLYE
jgi:hypothetical protein